MYKINVSVLNPLDIGQIIEENNDKRIVKIVINNTAFYIVRELYQKIKGVNLDLIIKKNTLLFANPMNIQNLKKSQ